jgi:hypothetical protein
MAAKKATERIPSYTDPDGFKLVVDDQREGWIIGWASPEDGVVDAVIGNEYFPADKDPDRAWCISTDTLKEYFTKQEWGLPEPGEPFAFESERHAKEALRLINAKLHYAKQNKPIPDWAEKALAAGWSPPKGWKP